MFSIFVQIVRWEFLPILGCSAPRHLGLKCCNIEMASWCCWCWCCCRTKESAKVFLAQCIFEKKTCAGNILHFPNCFNKPPKGRLHGDLSHGVQQQCIRCSLKSKTFGTRPRATLPLFKVKLEKFGATALIKILAPIEFLCFGLHLSPVIFILF